MPKKDKTRSTASSQLNGGLNRPTTTNPPIVLGGQVVNEQEFEDERLCQICCFLQIDTEFVPC